MIVGADENSRLEILLIILLNDTEKIP